MIKAKQDGGNFILTNNNLVGILVAIAVTMVIGAFLIHSGNTLIGAGVAVLGLAIFLFHKTQSYIFNSTERTLTINYQSVFNKSSNSISLDEVTQLRVVPYYSSSSSSDSGSRERRLMCAFYLDLAKDGYIKIGDMAPTMQARFAGINRDTLPKSIRDLISYLNITVEIEPVPSLGGIIKAAREAIREHQVTEQSKANTETNQDDLT